MATLSANAYHAGLQVMQQLAAARSADAFARLGVELLGQLVSSELTTLSICDLLTGHRRVISTPAGAIGASERTAFDRHFDEHPLVRHHAVDRGRDAHRISDSIPFARFRNTALYADYYRRVGIDHVIAVPLHVDQRLLVSFVLNRSRRDFSDRDRALLDMLAGGLGELYRRSVELDRARAAALSLAELLDSYTVGAIRLASNGEVRDFSPHAAEQMQRLWGTRLRRGARLPAELSASLARPLHCTAIAATLSPAVRAQYFGRLTVRTYPWPEDDGAFIVLEESAAADAAEPVDRWPLSPRERDVLHWLAAGKTDRDIGRILGISPRTVHKHLQRTYEKLGVETRTAAVMRALGVR